MMYKAKVHEITSKTRSTRWNDPSTTTSEIRIAAIGALSQGGMPTRDAAARDEALCCDDLRASAHGGSRDEGAPVKLPRLGRSASQRRGRLLRSWALPPVRQVRLGVREQVGNFTHSVGQGAE